MSLRRGETSLKFGKKQLNGKLPVFVYPEELNFVRNDCSTQKTILTVYNPYDFDIKYKGKRTLKSIALHTRQVYATGYVNYLPISEYFNHYELTLSFDRSIVLSNRPNSYLVSDAEGAIMPHCCADM